METAFPVTNVPVSLIDRSPTNPRKRFEERELQELARLAGWFWYLLQTNDRTHAFMITIIYCADLS